MPIADTSCPVIEQIARVLFTRLKRLLDQSYHTKTQKVVRPIRLGQDWTPEHLMVLLTQGDEETGQVTAASPPKNDYTMRFNIRCFLIPSEKDPTPIDQQANFAAADIRKAVVNSDSEWFSFNDANGSRLALEAEWGGQERIASDGGVDSVLVPLNVMYRISEHDAYAVA